ncbi:MAG: EAL domain-containing protein, partial [Pseudomonadota bacterium]|nr:EAL domain-containing protein [Pseudomonadota bacterium]
MTLIPFIGRHFAYNRFHRIFWPVLAIALCAAIWAVSVTRANAELARADERLAHDAGAFAEAYEQYVTRSVGQMDQVTMQLKHSWEHTRSASLLEDLKRDGMFTDSAFVMVSVVGRDGRVRSSTRPEAAPGDLSAAPLFVQHKNNISTAMRIGAAPAALALQQSVILFSRRLDTADDEFDGVLLLAVEARYFTSFVNAATVGASGLLAVRGTEGRLRLEQRGDGSADGAAALLPERLPGGAGGVQLLDGENGADGFTDGVARMVGWRRSSAYPLVALVALSRADAQAGAAQYWRDSRANAITASVCLALLAWLANLLARRAALRMREQDEVRSAYRTATESATDGFYMATALRDRRGQIVDFRIVDCNERGAFFLGMERAALVGRRLSLINGSLLPAYRAAMESGFHEEDRRIDGADRLKIAWGHRRMVRVGNGLAVTLRDISERKAHEVQLQRLANEDSLTGLPNRHWLLNYLPGALEQARAGCTQLAVLFIDLDEFKHVNDTQGHAVGDQLLRAAAQRLAALLRPSDQVVRFGGDEFIVVLTPTEGDAQVGAVAARIVTAFGAPFAIADDIQTVGASVGISVFPRDGADASALIKHSDIAMYSGKTEGKGQLRFFDPSLSQMLNSRAQLRGRLVEAIEQDQFELHYQARVDTLSGELLSMEALLRWRHPSLGMIAPGEFIPLAESSGLILQIGAMVIEKACAQIAAWLRHDAQLVVPVSINVSPKQFLRGDVKLQLAAALARHGIAPALLEVEITESAMMGDQDEVVAELAAIRSLGIKLHVDDFGTGYSSLSQLQRLKMDVLKVDRAFTAQLGESKEGRVFFQAIVSMAHALSMAVVAEGVETAQQLALLRALGCNEVQGYFIARPVPAQDMLALM